jgi:heavy metal sensor kinase
MRSLPIRVRLTAWYSLILALSFCVFGAIAYFGMTRSIRATVDASLHSRIEGVRQIIEETAHEGVNSLQDELGEFADVKAAGDLLRIADQNGNLLYSSSDPNWPDRQRMKSHPSRPFYQRIKGTQFRVFSQTVEAAGSRYQVQVAISTQAFDDAIDRFRIILYLSAPLLLGLSALGGYWMSGRALAPVDEITQSARTIGAQNLSQRLAIPHTGDELERLTVTLNEMLERLDAAFKKITQFTADASHELRTPVAVIRTGAELTLRKPRTESEYREVLSQVLREAEKTSKLIEELLILARADSGAAALPLARTNAAECLEKACQQGSILAEAKQLEFREHIPAQAVWVRGDAASLERLFLILVDNAVKYTPPGGQVEVNLGTDDGFAIAEVRDTGIGISAEDLPRVFDRFYRADRARSRESGGTGLGLAIGRWIVEAHGGEVRVHSEPAKGSSFQVRLPLATE